MFVVFNCFGILNRLLLVLWLCLWQFLVHFLFFMVVFINFNTQASIENSFQMQGSWI